MRKGQAMTLKSPKGIFLHCVSSRMLLELGIKMSWRVWELGGAV